MSPEQELADIKALLRMPYAPPGAVADRLTEDLAALRQWSDSARALACPRCGCHLKWGCPSHTGDRGRAECHDGARVRVRIPGLGEPCTWPGGEVERMPDGSVVLR